MKNQIITLFEHQEKLYQELGWSINDPHISQLERLVADTNTPIFYIGRHSLKTCQFVGIVRLGDFTFQILPKIEYEGSSDTPTEGESRRGAENSATSNLLSLLSYTHDIQLRARDQAALKSQPSDWFELLTRLYAEELHAQLRFGMEYAYNRNDETLPVIRGRWQISRQLTVHPHIQHRFDVIFDEFSSVTPLNQVFRFVSNWLLQVTADNQNRRYLQDIQNWLDVPAQLEPRVETLLPLIHFSRLNERFRPAYNMASLFLDSLAFRLSAGNHEVFAFVFDMNRLFEQFVGKFLIRHWKHICPKLLQETNIVLQSVGRQVYLAENPGHAGKPVFQLIPDIQFTDISGRPRLIADTKYKKLIPHGANPGVAEGDLYQMIAYSLRYECPSLLLLFPQMISGKVRDSLQIQNQLQTIRITTLNLHVPLNKPDLLIREFIEVLSPSLA